MYVASVDMSETNKKLDIEFYFISYGKNIRNYDIVDDKFFDQKSCLVDYIIYYQIFYPLVFFYLKILKAYGNY